MTQATELQNRQQHMKKKKEKQLSRVREIERTIVKTYRKDIWGRFVKAVERYELINDGDCIAVCVSGGKDSALLAKLIQLYHRYGVKKFDVKFLSMDPGYSEFNRQRVESNAKLLDIPLQIFPPMYLRQWMTLRPHHALYARA